MPVPPLSMLLLGSLLALASGMLMALAAALEKYEGMRTALASKGFALLAALVRRPLWVVGIIASALGWVLETAALVLSPVPVVATLRNAGRGVLIPFGRGWLAEHFGSLELTGIVLTIVGGGVTAFGSSGASIVRKPLPNLTLIEVAAGCALFAGVVAEFSRRLAGDLQPDAAATDFETVRSKAAGIAAGAAVGVLFAGTGIYSKEIGDRIGLYGFGGLSASFGSPAPYLMVASTVWAQSILQQAFRRANAASVASANASVASTGLIAAGFALYGQHISGAFGGLALFGGIVVATVGTVLLAASRPALPVAATLAHADLDGPGARSGHPGTEPIGPRERFSQLEGEQTGKSAAPANGSNTSSAKRPPEGEAEAPSRAGPRE